ncbi:MAG: S8 family serine peptidase [Cytophagales bacterium]|nr:S8 family serine peptidase [Cytophagales bacterium]
MRKNPLPYLAGLTCRAGGAATIHQTQSYMTSKFMAGAGACAAVLLLGTGCGKQELQELQRESVVATANARIAAADPSVDRIRSGHYIVISATAGSLPANLARQLAAAGGTLTASMEKAGLAAVSSSRPDFAATAAKIAGVRSVIPDLTVQGYDPASEKSVAVPQGVGNLSAGGEDDPGFDLQWGLKAIKAPQAWNAGYRGKGAVVAVLDTGFDLDHPDLAANFLPGKNFVPGEELEFKGNDILSHGTHVAGIIAAADNGLGMIGVAPEAKILPVKVLADDSGGAVSWIIQGIMYAADQGADVINMSFGGYVPRNGKFLDDKGTPDPSDDIIINNAKAVQEVLVAYSRATTYAYQQGATLIAAAGNNAIDLDKDQSFLYRPSGFPHVICISATAPKAWALDPVNANPDILARYSNYGVSAINFAAPGGDWSYYAIDPDRLTTVANVTLPVWVFDMVYSTNRDGGYRFANGTSMAAPHAAGVAALIVGKLGGNASAAQVESMMRASADDLGQPGKDAIYGHGRVNAYRAVLNAQ